MTNETNQWWQKLGQYLQIGSFLIEFSSDVDVGGSGSHGPASDETTLDQSVGVVTHDLAIWKNDEQIQGIFFRCGGISLYH